MKSNLKIIETVDSNMKLAKITGNMLENINIFSSLNFKSKIGRRGH